MDIVKYLESFQGKDGKMKYEGFENTTFYMDNMQLDMLFKHLVDFFIKIDHGIVYSDATYKLNPQSGLPKNVQKEKKPNQGDKQRQQIITYSGDLKIILNNIASLMFREFWALKKQVMLLPSFIDDMIKTIPEVTNYGALNGLIGTIYHAYHICRVEYGDAFDDDSNTFNYSKGFTRSKQIDGILELIKHRIRSNNNVSFEDDKKNIYEKMVEINSSIKYTTKMMNTWEDFDITFIGAYNPFGYEDMILASWMDMYRDAYAITPDRSSLPSNFNDVLSPEYQEREGSHVYNYFYTFKDSHPEALNIIDMIEVQQSIIVQNLWSFHNKSDQYVESARTKYIGVRFDKSLVELIANCFMNMFVVLAKNVVEIHNLLNVTGKTTKLMFVEMFYALRMTLPRLDWFSEKQQNILHYILVTKHAFDSWLDKNNQSSDDEQEQKKRNRSKKKKLTPIVIPSAQGYSKVARVALNKHKAMLSDDDESSSSSEMFSNPSQKYPPKPREIVITEDTPVYVKLVYEYQKAVEEAEKAGLPPPPPPSYTEYMRTHSPPDTDPPADQPKDQPKKQPREKPVPLCIQPREQSLAQQAQEQSAPKPRGRPAKKSVQEQSAQPSDPPKDQPREQKRAQRIKPRTSVHRNDPPSSEQPMVPVEVNTETVQKPAQPREQARLGQTPAQPPAQSREQARLGQTPAQPPAQSREQARLGQTPAQPPAQPMVQPHDPPKDHSVSQQMDSFPDPSPDSPFIEQPSISPMAQPMVPLIDSHPVSQPMDLDSGSQPDSAPLDSGETRHIPSVAHKPRSMPRRSVKRPPSPKPPLVEVDDGILAEDEAWSEIEAEAEFSPSQPLGSSPDSHPVNQHPGPVDAAHLGPVEVNPETDPPDPSPVSQTAQQDDGSPAKAQSSVLQTAQQDDGSPAKAQSSVLQTAQQAVSQHSEGTIDNSFPKDTVSEINVLGSAQTAFNMVDPGLVSHSDAAASLTRDDETNAITGNSSGNFTVETVPVSISHIDDTDGDWDELLAHL